MKLTPETAREKVDHDLKTWDLHITPELRDRIASVLYRKQQHILPRAERRKSIILRHD